MIVSVPAAADVRVVPALMKMKIVAQGNVATGARAWMSVLKLRLALSCGRLLAYRHRDVRAETLRICRARPCWTVKFVSGLRPNFTT